MFGGIWYHMTERCTQDTLSCIDYAKCFGSGMFWLNSSATGARYCVLTGISPDQIGSALSSSSSFGIPDLVLAIASSSEKANAVFFLTSLSFMGRKYSQLLGTILLLRLKMQF